jgi:hypothetical protein
MKKLLAIGLVILLSGCTVVDSYMLTHYDANEYAKINTIRFKANQYKAQCSDPVISSKNAVEVSDLTQEFEFYSEHIPRNDDGYKIAKTINEIAQGLKTQYETTAKVNAIFCKFKFESIERSAELAQKTIGARPR